jgi:mRNA interferase MazF
VVAIKRGDIILCDFNPVIGTEQSGIRPAVIIQIDRVELVNCDRIKPQNSIKY